MNPTKNSLPEATRVKSIELLNARLADALALYTHAKQAHWNVKGPSFIALHKLFDDVAEHADEFADMIAERLVALGGVAQGTIRHAAQATQLADYPLDTRPWKAHVEALAGALATFNELLVKNITAAEEVNDPATADLFTEAAREVAKDLWFVESHLQD